MKVQIKPVITSDNFKVISVSGQAGDILEKHKVSQSSLLLVKKGIINYKEESGKTLKLKENDGHNIPPNIYHKVVCEDIADFFVIIPLNAKMKFEK